MYKRSRGSESSLTGGTGDVNPQFMHLKAVMIANDTYLEAPFPLPVQRLQLDNSSQVMEVLKVWFEVAPTLSTSAAQTNIRKLAQITTKSQTAIVNINEPSLVAKMATDAFNAFTPAQTYGTFAPVMPVSYDLTDGAGHGLLVGTDNLYFGVDTDNTGGTSTFYCNILYRWKNISKIEYVGLVQSQT